DGETVKLQYKESYLYGDAVSSDDEAAKPVKAGYSFAGWKYAGIGERPSAMPGMDITAKGSFVALDTEYDILYFTENLDGTYSLNEKITRTDKTGTEITFAADENSEYVKDIDGFTVDSVAAETDGVSMKKEDGTASAKGTLVSGTDGRLSVSYFYTRNTYRISLNILKNSEGNENVIYEAYWNVKYGENVASLAEKIAGYYENGVLDGDSTYCVSPDETVKNEDVDLTGFILANYIDYSTGSCPVLMPNGDVTVNREYISDVEKEYYLNVYFEKADGTFVKNAKLTYFAPVGYMVSVIDGENTSSDHYNAYTSQLSSLIEGFEYYELKESTSGTVTADGSLTLDAYFERKTYQANIYYYYNTDSTRPENAFRIVTLSGKWGTLIDAFDPLLYFDSEDETVNGKTYKDNNCVVSYSSYYDINTEAWPQYQFSTVASLTDNVYKTNGSYRVLFGHHTVNAYVRYIPVSDIQFGLNVQYTQFEGSTVPVTYRYSFNGVESDYRFRIVNKRRIFNASFSSSVTDFEEYPGLEYLYRNGSFTYGDVKTEEGWEELTELSEQDNSDSYRYFVNTNDTDKVIYIVKSGFEDLYAGSRYGVNLDNSIPYILMKDYENTYNGNNDRKIVLYNKSASGIRNRIDGQDYLSDGTFTFNFRERHEYRLYHSILGNLCSGHKIYEGDNLSLHDLNVLEDTCEYVISSNEVKTGYNLNFYNDGSFTSPLTEKTDVQSSITVYGRYTRDTLTYHKYAHYEIPQGGYITIDAVTVTEDGITASVNGNTVTLTKEEENLPSYSISDNGIFTVTVTPVRTVYLMNGEVVLVDEAYETFTYAEIEMDYTKYGKDYYLFSEKNPLNRLNGYIEVSPVSLKAYYERVKYTLTKDDANETDITSSVKVHGESVTFADPERPGYEFGGWKFTSGTGTAIPVATDKTEAGTVFAMPKMDTTVTALWINTDVDIPVMHFIRTEGSENLEDMVLEVLTVSAMAIEDADIKVGNTVKSGKAYYLSDLVQFVSVNDNGREYFYLPDTEEDDVITADAADPFAVAYYLIEEVESEIVLSDEVLDLSYAELDSMVVDTLKGISSETEKVSAEYGMKLTYYYVRLHNLNVTADAVSTDSGTVTAAINVSGGENGLFSYGENAVLSSGAVPGYTFNGWFSKTDVISEGGKLMESWVDVTPLSTGSTYSLRVYDDTELVSVFTPLDLPQDVRVTLSPNENTLTFGYTSAEAGNISATVILPEGTESTVKVKSYKWYAASEDGEIKDTTVLSQASSLKIPQGLAPGKYYYKCIVEIERTDNGRTRTLQSKTAALEVVKADLIGKAESYTGTYDGKYHSIKVALDSSYENLKNLTESDYTVYYSESPIDTENMEGLSTEEILKKDVKISSGEVSSYDIYYAVVPNEEIAYAYNMVTGHETVTIEKKRLTLNQGDAFNKVFDNETDVLGTLKDNTSDMYRLSFGSDGKKYYIISGLADGDSSDDFTASFDAEFNSAHSNDAGSVTLSNVKLVYAADTDKENTNYYFDEMFTIGLSGSISKKELKVEWSVEEGDNATVSGNHFTYVFNTEVRLPHGEVKDIPEGLKLETEGAQRYAGENYVAQAYLVSENQNIDARDYTLLNSSVLFSIDKLHMGLSLGTVSVTYDGNIHTVESAVLTLDGVEDSSIKSGSEFEYAGKNYSLTFTASPLVSGEARPDIKGFTDAGIYPYSLSGIRVYDANGTNVTDSISLDVTGGSLEILPVYLKIGNILVSDKVYDGTDSVTAIDVTKATFDTLVGNDMVFLDSSKVSARFEDKETGKGKTVYVEIAADALTDSNGKKAVNYAVLTGDNESSQHITSSASITENSITVAPGAFSDITYGDNVSVSLKYESGLQGEDKVSDVTVKGTVKFNITGNGKEHTVSYTFPEVGKKLSDLSSLSEILFSDLKLDAGTYEVIADCSGLSTENYKVESSEVSGAFRVSEKSIFMVPSTIPEGKGLSKVYDGNTDVPSSVLAVIGNSQSDYFTLSGVMEGDTVSLKN
ncbi:MAG: InlB B-repeat-containing protein, partial [Clostridia bacterium]|nr:InlB B-repeat-containing protein [Clostridia bacterium]